MPRQTITLNDTNWLFGCLPRRPFAAPDVYDLPAVTEWLPATIPGNVRTDLLAMDRIPDPFFGEQYKESLWVEEMDWWYRRVVEPPATFGTESRAFLVFEGIDYLSAIFVNGVEMARHEGMFSRQIIEITGALRSGPLPIEIAVRLWGSGDLPKRKLTRRQQLWQKFAGWLYRSWVGIYPDRSATLKCQMSFGWDFAPPIRAMGIWDDVSLVVTGPVGMVEASVIGHQLPLRNKRDATDDYPAESNSLLTIFCSLDALASCRVEVVVSAVPANFEGANLGPFRFWLDLPVGRSDHQLRCRLPEAALWQPWDRGYPHLYRVHLAVTGEKGLLFDEVSLRAGIRTVELKNWQFKLNGRREFIRGLNWVPADSFPGRLRPENYARLLKMARESGANLLRVWGGGLREKQAFYDLCDELGLLIWQEFPFACMFLGGYPSDPDYLARVEAECSAIVRQLRHHPSLILWCGGNEFSRSRNRSLLDTLAAIARQHDGSRPFIPVSPSFDHGGDAHNWTIWHGYGPLQTYQAETARFLSEFGLQALPHPDTLAAALPNPAKDWQTHHADLKKLARYADLFKNVLPPSDSPCVDEIEDAKPQKLHPLPESLRKAIIQSAHTKRPISQSLISNLPISNPHTKRPTSNPHLPSQLAQATALQTAIEHMRCRKGEAGGVCLWQFNEPWPAISWAIVDYFGRPKLAYERLKMWYSPALVSLKFPVGRRWLAGQIFTAEIWAINDSDRLWADCELQITLDEALICTQSLDLPPNSAQQVGLLTHLLPASPRQMSLTLRHQAEIVTYNHYDLNWRDESGSPLSLRLRRRLANWALR